MTRITQYEEEHAQQDQNYHVCRDPTQDLWPFKLCKAGLADEGDFVSLRGCMVPMLVGAPVFLSMHVAQAFVKLQLD